MTNAITEISEEEIERLIEQLDSLLDGDGATEILITMGRRAVPYLERFLLEGRARTIALPRTRAVRALGELGAWSALIAYFKQYERPDDAAVLFAEDAVRSAAARELGRWKSDEVYKVLLDAARERATSGLILALGEFRKPESVPLLFAALDDDLCREEAKVALRRAPEIARQYAILWLRGAITTESYEVSALRRRRATLQLLSEFGTTAEEWADLRVYLQDRDVDVVIAAATIGFRAGPQDDYEQIIEALFRISMHLNWAQEDDVTRLLDHHRELAREVARRIVGGRQGRGEHVNWLVPLWRILKHVLGTEMDSGVSGAA
jgi:hypothetical protein